MIAAAAEATVAEAAAAADVQNVNNVLKMILHTVLHHRLKLPTSMP
jgi:hypothetical protein